LVSWWDVASFSLPGGPVVG
jgi:hypothetical protein